MPDPAASSTRGRRPGSPATRTAILDTARALIRRHGATATTLRGVAREAGVDSALVVHYFKNRRGLLAEALRPEQPLVPDFAAILSAGAPDRFGERLVAVFVDQIDDPDAQANLMLRMIGMGADDDIAHELLRELIQERFITPLTAMLAESDLPVRDPALAAELAASQLTALLLSHAIPAFTELRTLAPSQLITRYGALVQHAITRS